MILNTGARTDTVQYFSEWLFRRFREGYVYTRNPLFPHKVTRYELSPDRIDCVLFCSKNYAPVLSCLHEITDRYRTYFHFTITAYGREIEPGVPSIDDSVGTLKMLSALSADRGWHGVTIPFCSRGNIRSSAISIRLRIWRSSLRRTSTAVFSVSSKCIKSCKPICPNSSR